MSATITRAITRADRHTPVCERCRIADRAPARMRGLLGRDELPAGEGVLLSPASSIHTHFMRFAIDAVFLDRDMRVITVRKDLEPWSMACVRHARSVLELRAGEAIRRGIAAGDVLRVDDPEAAPDG